jgi:hypothetical protein
MSMPSKRIRPALGLSMPAMVRMSELLPAPFEPMTVTRLLRGTSKVTPFKARASP